MSVISSLILTNQLPINTYTASVLTSGSVIANGLGNQITYLELTSSFSTTSSFSNTASYVTSNGNAFSFKNPQTIDTLNTMSHAHGLGAIPSFVRCVLVCESAELDYSVNDEVDISGLSQNTPEQHPTYTFGANDTTLFCAIQNYPDTPGPLGSPLQMYHRATASISTITNSKWALKMYAKL